MENKVTTAIKQRLTKSKTRWRQVRKRIFNNHQARVKTTILLRNALIRPTMEYALQTTEITNRNTEKLESDAYKCIRQINGPQWIIRTQSPKEIQYITNYNIQ